jgi:hypothetical protein
MYHIKLHIHEKLKHVISELSKQQLEVPLHLGGKSYHQFIMQHFLFITGLVMAHSVTHPWN